MITWLSDHLGSVDWRSRSSEVRLCGPWLTGDLGNVASFLFPLNRFGVPLGVPHHHMSPRYWGELLFGEEKSFNPTHHWVAFASYILFIPYSLSFESCFLQLVLLWNSSELWSICGVAALLILPSSGAVMVTVTATPSRDIKEPILIQFQTPQIQNSQFIMNHFTMHHIISIGSPRCVAGDSRPPSGLAELNLAPSQGAA